MCCTQCTHLHRNVVLSKCSFGDFQRFTDRIAHCCGYVIICPCLDSFFCHLLLCSFLISSSSSSCVVAFSLLYCSLNGRIKIQYCATFDRITFSASSMVICRSHDRFGGIQYAWQPQRPCTGKRMSEFRLFAIRKLFTHQKSKCNDSDPMEIKSK